MSLSKDEVVFLREKYSKLNSGLIVYGDNMIISSENKDDGSYIVWDDVHLVYHNIKPNRHPDYKEQSKFPITVQSTNYDQIQYLNSSINQKDFEVFLDSLITDGVMTADEKNQMIQKYKDLKVIPI